MEKYLGNKRVLLDDILSFCSQNCPDAKSVYDAFSGTTNVARMFQNKGFSVFANDINRFSYVLGSTYLGLSKYPVFQGLDIKKVNDEFGLEARFYSDVKRRGDQLFDTEKTKHVFKKLQASSNVLAYLNSLTEKNKKNDYHILNNYTETGDSSFYKSLRGTEGHRNYFSRDNAILLDNILCEVRSWYRRELLSKSEVFYLLTAVIEEVVLNANVSGTFHDFNRKKLWPNSLQRFYLKIPLASVSKPTGYMFNGDALQVSGEIPEHDVLYIDPPYNFRQYTSYYHLLNFIAIYPFLDDVDEYISGITYVRGQREDDDFASDFCFKDRFIDALDALISQSRCKYVVMSYYGGRNHWNHWSKEQEHTDVGFNVLEEYFSRDKFCSHSSSSVTKLRLNYQSRVGEKKGIIDEYLFFAKKIGSEPINKHKPKERAPGFILFDDVL